MSTVGYGDIVPTNTLEITFATVSILFGGLIIPVVAGGLVAYLGNINATEKAHRKKLEGVKKYLQRNHSQKKPCRKSNQVLWLPIKGPD